MESCALIGLWFAFLGQRSKEGAAEISVNLDVQAVCLLLVIKVTPETFHVPVLKPCPTKHLLNGGVHRKPPTFVRAAEETLDVSSGKAGSSCPRELAFSSQCVVSSFSGFA